LLFAKQTERRIWPFIGFGVITLASLLGLVLTASWLSVMFATFLGFSAAGVLALSLALPAILSAPADIGRMAAAMFTIGYGLAVVLTVLGGALWDLSADARFAFLPIAVGALPLVLLAPSIRHVLMSRNGG
jgi:CP family cyanate transporter-like MFS transporter